METKINIKFGEYDWLSTRLSPRKYYPPTKAKMDSKLLVNINPRRLRPLRVIYIPGVEGMGISWGKYKGERRLLFHIAHSTPFIDEVRNFSRQKKAIWNDVFNTWDVPILSQSINSAIKEAWVNVEEAYFELHWSKNIELHWCWDVGEKNALVLERRICKLNNFWETGDIDHEVNEVEIVYRSFGREELERRAVESFVELYPNSEWRPTTKKGLSRVCVNYLRHKCSCYHVLLKTEASYISVFRKINQAIAIAYPWLKEEAMQQIAAKAQK